MIDLASESSLSLYQAARLLPPGRGDRPVTISCILRWILHGSRGPSGEMVKLEAVRLGSRWVTSREALQRFVEALTPTQAPRAAAPQTPAKRRRSASRASGALDRIGI